MRRIEDLHWIDGETQAFLNLLAEGMVNAPVQLPARVIAGVEQQDLLHAVAPRSAGQSAEQMLSALLGDGAELAPLKHFIIEKTEGNPLFMEQIFQALRSGAQIRRRFKDLERSSFWKGTQAKDRLEKVYLHKGNVFAPKSDNRHLQALMRCKKLLLIEILGDRFAQCSSAMLGSPPTTRTPRRRWPR